MKRRYAVLAAVTAVLLLAACGSNSAQVSGEGKDPGELSQEASAGGTATAAAEAKEDGTETADTDVSSGQAQTENLNGNRKLHIYYSNEMADGLEVTLVDADAVTPELLLSNLAKYNIVTPDTKVRSFETEKEGEETVAILDLSREFGNYVSTMGTSGEYVILAALTDTFLDAYQADRLRLFVEGNCLETGHALYDWDFTRYPLTSYTVESVVFEKGNIHVEYPRLINMKDSFTETEWNEILESHAMEDVEYLDEDAEYSLTYEVATSTEELLCIVYRVNGYEPGAAHPYSYIQTFNIDLNSGKEVRLSDFVDIGNLLRCLTSGTGFELVNTELSVKDFQEYLTTSPDMLTKEYFENFDLNFMDPNAHPMGYSYKKDGSVIVCMEVNHAMGDFVEVKIR